MARSSIPRVIRPVGKRHHDALEVVLLQKPFEAVGSDLHQDMHVSRWFSAESGLTWRAYFTGVSIAKRPSAATRFSPYSMGHGPPASRTTPQSAETVAMRMLCIECEHTALVCGAGSTTQQQRCKMPRLQFLPRRSLATAEARPSGRGLCGRLAGVPCAVRTAQCVASWARGRRSRQS